MKLVIDYFIVTVCAAVILMELLKIIRLVFDPPILRRRVFEYGTDKLRLVLLSISGIMVLLMTILIKLGKI